MNENHDLESGIRLSAAVANQLPTISGAQLKVYVHLCASHHAELFSATMEQIGTATGLTRRAVIEAVKALSEKNLVSRLVGKGGRANQYVIPLDAPRQVAVTAGRTSQDRSLTDGKAEAANPLGGAESEPALAASVAGLDEVLSNITERLFSCILRQGAANSGRRLATAATENSDGIEAPRAVRTSVGAVEASPKIAINGDCARPRDQTLMEGEQQPAHPIVVTKAKPPNDSSTPKQQAPPPAKPRELSVVERIVLATG